MYDLVYTPDPINWQHPLNVGRAAWWLTIPPLDGGTTLYDICGRENLVQSGTGLSWSTTPYGCAGMSFPGSGLLVGSSGTPAITTNRLTVGVWVKPNVLTRGDMVTRWTNGVGSSQFNLLYGVTTGKPALYVSGGSAVGGGTGPDTMTVGKWHRVVATYDGSSIRVYLNAALQVTQAISVTLTTSNLTAYRLGNNSLNQGQCNASLADAFVANRVWSASEVQSDYELSQRGYPEVLNRLSNSSVFLLSSASGSTNTYNETMLGGAYVAGSANTFKLTTAGIVPSGVLGGGTSPVSGQYIPSSLPTGCIVGSAVQLVATYSPQLAPAGATSSPISDTTAIFSPVSAMVGVWGSGSSANTCLLVGQVGLNGSRASSGGLTSCLYYPMVAASGCWGNSSAISEGTFNLVAAADGPLAAGTGAGGSTVYSVTVIAAGVSASGGSPITAAYSATGQAAGCVVAGDATVKEIVEIATAAAGLLADGTALAPLVANPSMASGSLASGSSDAVAVLKPAIAPAGAWAAGNGITTIRYIPQSSTSGVWSDSTTAPSVLYNEVAIAVGVLSAGSGDLTGSTISIPVAPAGVVGIGHADIIEIATCLTSDGAVTSGSVAWNATLSPVATGGCWGSGMASCSTRHSETTSGLVLADGAATVAFLNGGLIASGAMASGAALLSQTIIVTGGAIVDGAAMPRILYSQPLGGGAKPAGAADVSIGYVNPTRLTYSRFKIGDTIYVPNPWLTRYLQQRVVGKLTWDGQDFWEVGLGWFPDRKVMSPDEYRKWLRQRASKAGVQ